MVSDGDIRDRTRRYLAGELSLDAFEAWFVAESWNFHRQPRGAMVESLVGAIELRLAEYSSGHLTDAELHSQLQAIVGGGKNARGVR